MDKGRGFGAFPGHVFALRGIHISSTAEVVEIDRLKGIFDAFATLRRPSKLLDRFQQVGHQAVEISVLLAHLLDFLDRVNHRRVVLAAEAAAELR